MYGGGFATIPAYLRDLFGTMHVSAIHGRVLTAWSAAGLAGPLLVNYLREAQIRHGVAPANAYFVVMYLMAGLLGIGFLCNLLVTPLKSSVSSDPQSPAGPNRSKIISMPWSSVHQIRRFEESIMIDIPRDVKMPPREPADSDRGPPRLSYQSPAEAKPTKKSSPLLVLLAWAVVAIPLAWGVTQTVKTSLALFHAPPQSTASHR